VDNKELLSFQPKGVKIQFDIQQAERFLKHFVNPLEYEEERKREESGVGAARETIFHTREREKFTRRCSVVLPVKVG
jgi:hypothetical protein